MAPLRVQSTNVPLKHYLDMVELNDLLKELAAALRKQRSLEDEKNESAANFKALITSQQTTISRLLDDVANGYRMVVTACEWNFHMPGPKEKTLFRLDTQEIVETQKMTEQECQEWLF